MMLTCIEVVLDKIKRRSQWPRQITAILERANLFKQERREQGHDRHARQDTIRLARFLERNLTAAAIARACRALQSPLFGWGKSVQITAPFGYGDIVPLEKTHRVLLPSMGAEGGNSTPSFCRKLNAMAISFSEFLVASRDYPIVFSTGDSSQSFAPLVVLGLGNEQNLFVNSDGEWATDTYVPAFLRRYPFCISKVYVDGEPQSEKVVCIDRTYLDPAGIALFDMTGKPEPLWVERENLLSEYEADLDLTAQMCAIFAKLDLFAPFTMQVTESGRQALELQGMYRVDEAKFLALKAANHKALVEKGLMGRIYAHFFSLANFARLYDRAVRQTNVAKRPSRGGK